MLVYNDLGTCQSNEEHFQFCVFLNYFFGLFEILQNFSAFYNINSFTFFGRRNLNLTYMYIYIYI